MSDSPVPSPDEHLEALLADCIGSDDFGAALNSICEEQPEHAARLRRMAARVESLGLLRDEDPRQENGGFPDRLGDFHLIRRLGEGGMGVVFEARDEKLGRRVALKLIRPELLFFAKGRERFAKEVAAAARLQHPGIVPVYSADEGDTPHYAMEFVDGRSLAEILESLRESAPSSLRGTDLFRGTHRPDASGTDRTQIGSMSWPDACARIALDVARALEHAHGAGVLHRDVKPSNIMLDRTGRPRLLDFGLAQTDNQHSITRTGTVLGSLPYMAPEMVQGDTGAATARTDIYSLGVTMFELLTLKQPFHNLDNADDTRRRILDGRAPDLRKLNSAVDRDTMVVCLKAMEADAARRYATAADFADDLENALERRPIQARPAGLRTRARRAVQRRPATALASLVVLIILLGAVGSVAVLESLAKQRETLAKQRASDARQRESEAKDRAVQLGEEADRLRVEAERSASRLSVVAASSLIQLGEAGQAQDTLADAPQRHRAWEWGHLEYHSNAALATFPAHPDPRINKCTNLDLDPSGRFAVCGSNDGTVTVLDLVDGSHQHSWETGELNAMAVFAGRADRVLSSGKKLKLYDLKSGEHRELAQHSSYILALAASRDGTLGASSSNEGAMSPHLGKRDSTLLIHDLETGQLAHRITVETRSVLHLLFSPDGRYLYGGTSAGELLRWDLEASPPQREAFETDRMKMTGMTAGLALSLDGKSALHSTLNNDFTVWNTETRGLVRGISKPWGDACFGPTGEIFATSTSRNTVTRVWRGRNGMNIGLEAFGHRSNITDIQYSSFHNAVVTAGGDGTVRLWHPPQPAATKILTQHTSAVRAVATCGDGHRLLTAGSDGRICLWNQSNQELVRELEFENTKWRTAAAHPNGWCVAANAEASARVFPFDDPDSAIEVELSPPQPASCVAWLPDGKAFALSGTGGFLAIVDRSGTVLQSLTPNPKDGFAKLAVAPDGSRVALATGMGNVEERSLSDLTVLRRWKIATLICQSICYSPDGETLLASSQDNRLVRLTTDAKGKPMEPVLLDDSRATWAIAFDPTGERMFNGRADGKIQVWDTASWRPMFTLDAHQMAVFDLQVCPVTHELISASWDRSVRLWPSRRPSPDGIGSRSR